jgi:hypothetical protein
LSSPKFRTIADHGIPVLKTIKEAFPEAIIAGGALRDAYHKKQIKDYDIFISAEDAEEDIYDESLWIDLLDLKTEGILCDEITNVSDNEEGSCTGRNFIDVVWEINKNYIDYNIIAIDMDPEVYVNEHFDIGLCKAYTDGKKIRLTEDFLYDSRHHLLSIVAKNMPQPEFVRMMDNHVQRIKLKYPGWKLEVPPEYQGYYKEYTNKRI